jgi:hypothetical protein
MPAACRTRQNFIRGVKTVIAFADRKRAADFERYLKTASGRAFAKKRL